MERKTLIVTESGTQYVLAKVSYADGMWDYETVTRISEVPILGAEHMVLADEEVLWRDQIVVGQSWCFRTARGPVRTTPIKRTDFCTTVLD